MKPSYRLWLRLLLVVLLPWASASRTYGWETRVPDDIGDAIVALPGGDLVVSGRTFDPQSPNDPSVANLRRLDAATGAVLWARTLDPIGASSGALNARTPALALDSSGNVFVGYGGPHAPAPGTSQGPFTVLKVRASDGVVLWRHTIDGAPGTDGNDVTSLAVTPDGDVVAAGSLALKSGTNPYYGFSFFVVKLAGANGTELWRYLPGETPEGGYRGGEPARALVVDASGDVFAGGRAGSFGFPGIVKLAGATGAPLWTASSPDLLYTLALTQDGDLLVGGETRESHVLASIERRSSSSGSSMWKTYLNPEGPADTAPVGDIYDLTVDQAGDIVAAGRTESPRYLTINGTLHRQALMTLTIAKLLPSDGSILWQSRLIGTATLENPGPYASPFGPVFEPFCKGEATAAGVEILSHRVCSGDPGTTCSQDTPDCDGKGRCLGGDPVVAGDVCDLLTGTDVAVVRVASADGIERWRHLVDGPKDGSSFGPDRSSGLALDAAGNVGVVGSVVSRGGYVNGKPSNVEGTLSLLALRLDPATGCPLQSGVSPTQDSDGDGLVDICDTCPAVSVPDASDADFDGKADVCDPCPGDFRDRCAAASTRIARVSASGGSVAAPDFSVSIDVPPGLFGEDTTIAITGGLPDGTGFQVDGQGQTVLLAQLGPDDRTFAQPVTVHLKWQDADGDGVVDGTTVRESDLQVWRDGRAFTSTCDAVVHQPGTCTDACCDSVANEWLLSVTHFSEYNAARSLGRCRQAMLKESAKFADAKAKALAKCELLKLKGKITGDCAADPAVAVASQNAFAKFAQKVGLACGGIDDRCGFDTTQEADRVALGWPASCPDFRGSGAAECTASLSDCDTITSCAGCIGESAVDHSFDVSFAGFVSADPRSAAGRCQQAIAKAVPGFVRKAAQSIEKCWEDRAKGKHAGLCPDATAALGSAPQKAASSVAAARAKTIGAVCKACGGADGACGGGDDVALPLVSTLASCPAITAPDGSSCAGPIASVSDLAQCLACVSESDVMCGDRGRLPQWAEYPASCGG